MSVISVRSENIVDKQWEIVEKELQDHVEALQRRSDQLLLRNLNRLKDLEQLSSRNSRKKKSKFEDLQRFDATQEKKQELIEQRKEFEKKYKNVFEGFCNEISKLVTSHQIVVEREFRKFEASLPIYSKRSTILEAVHSTQVVVLVGETGSEKSTQLAQYLAEEDSKEGIIFVTEPDKSTALGLAKQVSNEFLCKLGDEICVNSSVNDKTKIKFATHKDLLNEVIKGDEIIQQCSVIIIDQAQERSVDVDMLLAVLKQSLQCFSHLKLIIVSTQQNSCVFQDYFPGSTKITVPGKVYPVKTVYAEKRLPRYVDAVCDKVVEVCQSREGGDILVFLAQPHEIEKTCEKLKETLDDAKYIILPLYGKLELDQKSKVFETTPEGKRKIVVATNIAESWMVVPGIKIVIDSGMKMEASFYPLNNMTTLEAQLVNQNSAKQRASRAGLTGPGKCYCLFTKYDYNKMEKSSTPGISNVNLEFPVLQLLSFGVKNVESFDFVESPPPESLEMALKNLKSLGTIDGYGTLTDIGNEILQLPTEPRLSKALLEGLERGCGDDAVIAAALFYRGHNVFCRGTVHGNEDCAFQKQFCFSSGDLVSAVNIFKKWMALTRKKKILFCKQNALDTKLLRSVSECFKEIKNALLVKRPNLQFEVTTDDVRKSLCKSLLAGYPENIAMLCDNKDGDYITYVSKVNVKIHPSSVLSLLGDEPKYVMYQKLHKNSKTVFMENVTPIEFDWLSEVSGYVDMPFASKSPVNRQRTKHANDTIGCKKSRAKSVKEPVSNGKRVDTTHAEIRNAYPGHVYGVSGNDVNYVKRNQYLDHFEVSVFNVGGIKLLLSNALRTESILQPEACCKFDVFLRKVDLNAGVDAQKLIATLKNYGKVLNTCCYHRPSNDNTFYHWGTVTYCSSKEAKKASVFIQPLKDYIGSEDFAGQNVKGLCLEPTHAECFPSHSYSASSVRSTVIVSWFPLPAQRFAFVKCENEDILQKILKSLVQNMRPPLSGSSGASKRTDVGDICLPIIENANKRTVREILKKCCGPTLLEGVTKIRIPPKPLCHFNVEKEKTKLTKLLMNYSSAKLQSIRTINNKKVEAFVVFVNMDSAQTFVSEVNRTSDFLARLYEV
ncbi:pre-mRNA-splicing factor ATP-dependent RNA helicase DEAH1-like isoform X2 [Xenia sp. Carnegie-2017]|uniref:pre-mRNA-splicing factor ATP-dependent RNA helicase DEAH1-like isoform X2 n=1 Tax=Xenia sp. Carnegie-2017 TaxID=2897299 RepID=UPI001F03CDDF|nr:pre-mRNA-splicing factor ATP-dependent RNA helicase DEAH1-like isoform X2 [Xenia sp. Carnegie-2017]